MSTDPQNSAWDRTPSTELTGRPLARPLGGRLAIITGASRGIGAAIARNLASKGASLVLNFTSESSIQRTNRLATDLQLFYRVRCAVVKADLSTLEGPKHIVDTAKSQFTDPETGKFQIDIIINNAAVAGNVALEGVTPEEFSRQYSVNVLAPLLLVQAALPYLPTDRSGRIVNISSVSSSLGFVGQSVYGGTKAALEAMTRSWARELAERATVNAVNPGPVDTDMYSGTSEAFKDHMKSFIRTAPLQAAREGVDEQRVVDAAKSDGGRPAWDYEIAGVVGMLCSEESGWCTGSVVCANGGMKFSV
jgi:NAD(P)-dependent dehydrogenase (short-subunit alcohol dehydrogenase family)